MSSSETFNLDSISYLTGNASGCLLKKNIEILLEWTIPEDYMNKFREANKSVEEILEELAN